MDKELTALFSTINPANEQPPPRTSLDALIIKLIERRACVQVVHNEDVLAFSRILSAINGILRANHKEKDWRIRSLLANKNRSIAKEILAVKVLVEVYGFGKDAAKTLYRDTLKLLRENQKKRKRARRHKSRSEKFKRWTKQQSSRRAYSDYSQRSYWWDR